MSADAVDGAALWSRDAAPDDVPLTVIAQAARAGVTPSLREFLDLPETWRAAWVAEAEKVRATFATLIGIASQGPMAAAFVLAGAGDAGPLERRVVADAHADALKGEKRAPA